MVRVLVAFLIEVGKGRHEVSDVPKLLESKNRKNVPFTAPAEGLYLEKIYLDENELLKDFGNDIKIHRKKSLQNDWLPLTKSLWNYKSFKNETNEIIY